MSNRNRSFWKESITNWNESGVEILRETNWIDPFYTSTRPSNDAIKYKIPCDYIDYEWVLDETSDEFKNMYQLKREEEYPPIDELIVALWENIIEDRPGASVSLEVKRQAVKFKHQKPS